MVPRAFPQALCVGIDICRIARFERLITSSKIPNLLRHMFTQREQAYFAERYDVKNHNMWTGVKQKRVLAYLAGRWSAKEACIKAVKPQKVTLRQVEIWPDPQQGTYAIILDNVDEKVCLDKGELQRLEPQSIADIPSHESVDGQIARVSISHEEDYACAIAMAPCGRMHGGSEGHAEPHGKR